MTFKSPLPFEPRDIFTRNYFRLINRTPINRTSITRTLIKRTPIMWNLLITHYNTRYNKNYYNTSYITSRDYYVRVITLLFLNGMIYEPLLRVEGKPFDRICLKLFRKFCWIFEQIPKTSNRKCVPLRRNVLDRRSVHGFLARWYDRHQLRRPTM